MFLNDIKISTKLFLAFSFFIVLLIVSSVLSLTSLSRANDGMQTIISDDYPTTVKANELIDHLNDSIINQQLILLDEQGQKSKEWEKQLKDLSARVTLILDDLTQSRKDPESQKIIAGIKEIRQQYTESLNRVVNNVQQGNRQAALDEMMNNAQVVQQAYNDKIVELIALENRQMNTAGAQVETEYKSNRSLLLGMSIFSILAGVLIGLYIVRAITRPLDEAVNFAQAIAEGDLTGNITTQHKDETGVMLKALMEMKTRLLTIVQDVQNSAENISSAASQIVAGNQDLAARTEEQASSVEETAASMEQITATVKNTAGHTAEAAQISTNTATVVNSNGEMMKNVTGKMRAINETSGRMSDIINLIDSIAFQTNILALNAAVEAARAGEHGRGFAVVAGEVRQLAQKSASSASEIRSLIESSTTQAQEGMEMVEKAETLMKGMVSNVEEMNTILHEIGQASREQTDGISQVNSAIGLIDSTTQQNSCLVEESVAAAASLNDQALHLRELVKVFRVNEGEVA
ncbi:MAG: methyl-accepting chemotaxis protein [Yokenella regensburgei]|jgi:methyl-accepting chemotaxis protein-2 (aspartate sensor receptor)|uniref:Dipeptide chemoreceptor protein n=1 Tax=Yokenella regensburgei TaxID=158877 RepID=A0AB38FZG5_9ENTR|nr:methyl-accepting chemotaxis protein [Yokenella regensburgei]EHM49395.1 methyl-accepting chemotaxis protein signaling domain protein [Yokenella regensburgei ATCC 43003]KFD22970.1 methyl-accepting chemotaxis protein I [Yokenella regensburgei ATCC 49455]MDR3103083.1 methyl-accepting chemotaxis protein [Yokenella regensburgei]QIU90497.1 HAMP domain-containing protein [Yokenella regensburgei]SQA64769.1 Dipeptide chemoreceptor protein [Yokenella regensburgei]